mgnify:FL=1
MTYEVIHHTDTVKPEAWVVFVRKNGKLERAVHLGKRGGFKTRVEADTAAFSAEHYGTQAV